MYTRKITGPIVHPTSVVEGIYVAQLEGHSSVVPALMSLYSCCGDYPFLCFICYCYNSDYGKVSRAPSSTILPG